MGCIPCFPNSKCNELKKTRNSCTQKREERREVGRGREWNGMECNAMQCNAMEERRRGDGKGGEGGQGKEEKGRGRNLGCKRHRQRKGFFLI